MAGESPVFAGYAGGLRPLIIVTKDDLAPVEPVASAYSALAAPIVSVQRGADLAALQLLLADQMTVLIGQSGVGKSTLVNALVPLAERAIGSVNDVTGRGRHTSTSVQALQLPAGGWIIDTPGVRSFGLAHVAADRILAAFDDLQPGTQGCPRGCTHLDEHCALDGYAASGAAGPGAAERLGSLRRLLGALTDDAASNEAEESDKRG